MADNATGLPVKTLTGEFVGTKLYDAGGTNVAAVSAGGALSVAFPSAQLVDTELPSAAALADGAANPTVPAVGAFAMGYNGATWDRIRTANTGRLQVDVVTGGGGSQYVEDAVAGGGENLTLAGTVRQDTPASSNADGDYANLKTDSVGRLWVNASGAAVPVTDNADSLTVDAPVGTPVFVRLSDGAATLIGQAAMAASLPVVIASNQSAVAANITQVGGASQSATNPLFVRLTDGAAAYTAASMAPVDPKYSTKTSAALGAGASATLTHYVTSGKTGSLIGADVTATVPIKIEISTIVTGTPTTRVVAFALAGQMLQWRAPYKSFIAQASADATTGFGVVVTNKDPSVAADVYSTGYWDEG